MSAQYPTDRPQPSYGWPIQQVEQPPEPPKKPRRWLRVIASTIVVVFIAAIGFVALEASDSDAEAQPAPKGQATEQTTPSLPETGDPNFQEEGEEGIDPGDEFGTDEFSEDQEQPAPLPHKVGEEAVIQEEGLTGYSDIASIKVDKVVAFKSATSYGDTEYPENEWYVKFKVTVEAYDKGFEINPLDFFVRNADGSRLDSMEGNTMFVEADPEFDVATLKGGEKYTGWIVFDLPSKHGDFVYGGPGWGDSALAEWTF